MGGWCSTHPIVTKPRNYDFGLEICDRYYSGEQDFLSNSYAYGADNDAGIPIGICYSAGSDGDRCEIDVFVTENNRKNRVGTSLVTDFIANARSKGIEPTWDCYADNIPSRKLAENVGGKISEEYSFYNIIPQ